MKRHHKRLYVHFLKKLWQRDSPEKDLNVMAVYEVQEKIAQTIMRLERRLKNIKKPYTDKQKEKIKSIRWDISAFRLIGDALASIMIKPYTIREHCKHSPSTRYLIDQSGFEYELFIAKQFAAEGTLPIVHQTTNCLREGDISIPTGKGMAMIVETKSGEGDYKQGEEARINRQMARYVNLVKLYEEGELEPQEVKQSFPKLYPENTTLVRAETPAELKRFSEKPDFTNELNAALKQTLKDGQDRFVNIDGITAYIIRLCNIESSERALREGIQPLTPEQDEFIKDGVQDRQYITTLDIWNAHSEFPHLPPLTKLFEPEIAAKLVFGDLLLMTVMNGAKMASYLRNHGIEVDTSDENHFWKTHMCTINGREISLDIPFQYVMFAAHSTEFLANYCFDICAASEAAEKKLREKYSLVEE